FTYNFYYSRVKNNTYSAGYTDLCGSPITDLPNPDNGFWNPTVGIRPENNSNVTLSTGQQKVYLYNFDGGINQSIFTAKLKISNQTGTNRYIAFNLVTSQNSISNAEANPTSGIQRFLLWDNDGDGKYNYGGTIGPNVSDHKSSSINNYNSALEECLSVSVLTTTKHSYFIINGRVERVLTNVGGSTKVNIFQVYASNCTATFTNVSYAIQGFGSGLINSFMGLQEIKHYENNSYNGIQLLDVGSGVLSNFSTSGNQGDGCAVNNAHVVISNDSSFTFYTTIYIHSLLRNGHISFNFNGSSVNRFLLWDNDADGNINFAYQKGDVITLTDNKFYFGNPLVYFTLKIVVDGTSAKLYLDNQVKAEFTSSDTITSMSIGTEECAATFKGNYYT
ncbi:MAG: hypothetical protein J6C97_03490, partial [Clostridia bacterium]|nr:hypothetical protein [Clostridia bacterium]